MSVSSRSLADFARLARVKMRRGTNPGHLFFGVETIRFSKDGGSNGTGRLRISRKFDGDLTCFGKLGAHLEAHRI
jgi:hypothetical protein